MPVRTDELFRNHAAFVARFLSRLGVWPDELDDAVQEVFLVVHRNGGYTPGPATPTSYLASIALRAAANHRRRGRKSRERAADVAPDETSSLGQDPSRSLETQESLGQLQDALDELDPALRATLILAELEGQDCKTIAATLDVPVGTVYWRLHRARKQFRVALDSQALARDAVRRRDGSSSREASGAALFVGMPARALLDAAKSQSPRFDVDASLSRFHELLRAGTNLPSWAPAGMAAIGTGISLHAPAILSAVAILHLAGSGIMHFGAERRPTVAAVASMANPAMMSATGLVSSIGVGSTTPTPASSLVERDPDVSMPTVSAGIVPARGEPSHRAGAQRRPATRSSEVAPAVPGVAAEPAGDSNADEMVEVQDVASAEQLLATDPGHALSLAQAGETRFPNGYMREERRYVALRALFALGRVDEAEAQATRFLNDYPDGPFSQKVRAAAAHAAR